MTFGLVSGYCCGLRGEEARQENRIICVCWRGETSSGIQTGIWADRLTAVNKQRSRERGPLFPNKKQHRAKIGDFENQVLEFGWRKLDKARGMKPSFGMEDYYMEIKLIRAM
jgi:hypothetical protein